MGKIQYISIFAILMIVSLVPLLEVQGVEETPSRGGVSDPATLTLGSFDTDQYPGEDESFHISVYNDYDGDGFGGSTSPFNRSEMKEVKVSITGFYNEDFEALAVSPVEWIVSSIDDNAGVGFIIDQYTTKNIYADNAFNQLEFEIKSNGVAPGRYYIGFRVNFRYMIDWDGVTQWDWADGSSLYYVEFNVRSHIRGTGYPGYSIYGYEENMNTDPIHAGATNKMIGISGLYGPLGTVTDVSGTISFPGSSIVPTTPTVFNPSLPSQIIWRIDIPQNTPPGKYEISITFSYKMNGMDITEGATIQMFTVKHTPLLASPPSDDLNDPFLTFSRNDLPDAIGVPMTNTGNVDLRDATVRLDLDNARYIGDGSYFLNEDSYGNINKEGLEEPIEAIPVGETRTVEFNMLEFLPRLPPGLYKIPVDYKAIYDDDGATGNPTKEVTAGHWFEENRYEHREIMRNTVYPEDKSSNFDQYVLIEILPDPDGPLISAYIDSGYNQNPGRVNARMSLRVYNYEMYEMKNLIYRIHTDEGSPFSRPYSGANDSGFNTLEPVLRAGLSRSSGTSTSSDSFYFYANIKSTAAPGINYFKVDIEGYNEYNLLFNTTILGYLSINSHQPRFEPYQVTSGDILADRSVQITVEFNNVGLGGAKNLTCFYKSSTTGFVGMDPPMEIGSVMSLDSFAYSFRIRPDGERRYFNGYLNGYVYFSYYDDLGNFVELMSGTNANVKFDLYDKLPDLKIINVDAPMIDYGDEFEVTVTVMNIGGSETSGLKVLLPSYTSMFEVEEGSEQDLTDLAPGESTTITFVIQAEKEINDRTTYSFSMMFSYTDIMGRERTFSEGETESFNVRTKDRIIPSEQYTIVKDDGVLISEGAGNVLLGILIIIAAILFGGILTGNKVQDRKASKPVKPERPVAKKLVLEDDDDDEDDEDIDEEEDEDEKEEEDDGW